MERPARPAPIIAMFWGGGVCGGRHWRMLRFVFGAKWRRVSDGVCRERERGEERGRKAWEVRGRCILEVGTRGCGLVWGKETGGADRI